MNTNSKIATEYQLPYTVWHGPLGFMEGGGDVTLQLSFADPIEEPEIEMAQSLVTAFELLCFSGALSGQNIPPWASGVDDVVLAKQSHHELIWQFKNMRIDDQSVTILAQLFLLYHGVAPIHQLSILDAPNLEPPIQLAQVPRGGMTYPLVYQPLSSYLTFDGVLSSDLAVEVVFERDPTEAEAEIIRTRTETWIAAAAMGAYPWPPVNPDDCGLQHSGDIEIFEDFLQFGLPKFRCHPSAIFGLANALFAATNEAPNILSIEVS
jgi:hypothetical protein